MAKLSQTVLSARLTNEGRWAEWLHGIWFRVLPITHSSFQTALTKAREPFKSAIAAAPNNEEVGGILLRTVEETLYLLLTGCANVEDDDGLPVEFTQEWAREVCARADMDHLRGWIVQTASASSAYTRDGEATDEGNFRRLSAGG